MHEIEGEGENLKKLATKIKSWGAAFGFQQVSIIEPNLDKASQRLQEWLAKGFQGSIGWMGQHGDKRYVVDKLVDHTVRVISVRMDYLADTNMIAVLRDVNKVYISRYALGRDYHKDIRNCLASMSKKIDQ